MKPMTAHMGVCAPILTDNVDTDQIIPSREMKRVSKQGLGDGLFAGWRYVYDGMRKTGLRHDFVLNQTNYFGASIILAGKNFGCGSSREHAVWALCDFGIRAIIAESFGRIFRINCAKNGLLAIELKADKIELLRAQTSEAPQSNRVLVDLRKCEIHAPRGEAIEFHIDASDRDMLLEGLDHIDSTLRYADEIDAYIEEDREARAWAYL